MDSDVDDELQSRVLKSTIQQLSQHQEKQTEICVICLDNITEASEAQPCGHRHFDYHCLINWLFQKPRCPLCQTIIPRVLHLASGEITSNFYISDKALDEAQTQDGSLAQSLRQVQPAGSPIRRGPRRVALRNRGEISAQPSLNAAIERRREVYQYRRFSKHVGSNKISRYQEVTPRHFHEDEKLVSRARMWVRRELKVFAFLNTTVQNSSHRRRGSYRWRTHNAEFLLEYIIAILKTVDTMGSAGSAEEMLSDFLGRTNTRIFLHELRAWLRSPFTKLEDWDTAVQYGDSIVPNLSNPDEHISQDFAAQGRDNCRGR